MEQAVSLRVWDAWGGLRVIRCASCDSADKQPGRLTSSLVLREIAVGFVLIMSVDVCLVGGGGGGRGRGRGGEGREGEREREREREGERERGEGERERGGGEGEGEPVVSRMCVSIEGRIPGIMFPLQTETE